MTEDDRLRAEIRAVMKPGEYRPPEFPSGRMRAGEWILIYRHGDGDEIDWRPSACAPLLARLCCTGIQMTTPSRSRSSQCITRRSRRWPRTAAGRLSRCNRAHDAHWR